MWQDGAAILIIEEIEIVAGCLTAGLLVALHQVKVTQHQAHGEHQLGTMANIIGAVGVGITITVIEGETVATLYILHSDEVIGQQVDQIAGIGHLTVGIIGHLVDVTGGEERLLVEGNLAIGVYQLHVHPSTYSLYLRILTYHILAVCTGGAESITLCNICVTAVDYMIVIADAQVLAGTILILILITILTEIQYGCDGITHIGGSVHQVTTALIEDYIALCNILKRLHYTPIGVQRILRHLIGMALAVGCKHILA